MKKYKFIILIFLLCCNKLFSDDFTIAVIPDTQNYSYYKNQVSNYEFSNIWYDQMKYIVANSKKNNGDFVFTIHLGDLVESQTKKMEEWMIADKAMSILDNEIPFIVVPGNHDCDYWIKDNKNTKMLGFDTFTHFFGADSKYFKDKYWYGGAFNSGTSSWVTFEEKGYKFLIIGLEIEPSDEVLTWAQSVLDSHKDYATIIVSHEFLVLSYDVYKPGYPKLQDNVYLRLEGNGNSPKQVWEKLIKNNKQIFMVLCGHCFRGEVGEIARTDLNDFGYEVYQILSDFQGRKYKMTNNSSIPCGNGLLRLLKFNMDKKQIHIQTYSTEQKKYEKDMDSDFAIRYTWNWSERFSK